MTELPINKSYSVEIRFARVHNLSYHFENDKAFLLINLLHSMNNECITFCETATFSLDVSQRMCVIVYLECATISCGLSKIIENVSFSNISTAFQFSLTFLS